MSVPSFTFLISIIATSVVCAKQELNKPIPTGMTDASLVVLFLSLSPSLSVSAFPRHSRSPTAPHSSASDACHIPKRTGVQAQHPFREIGMQFPVFAMRNASLQNSFLWLYFKMRHISGFIVDSFMRNSFLASPLEKKEASRYLFKVSLKFQLNRVSSTQG